MKWGRYITVSFCLLGVAWLALADDLPRRYGSIEFKTAREADDPAKPTPTWPADGEFKNDAFVFARLRYDAQYDKYLRGHVDADRRWLIDFPACDLDLSYRLHQMTAIKVDPDGRVVKLTETNLWEFPFIYLIEPGRGFLNEEEVPLLRKYLLNGGFMMVDDFWGDREWKSFQDEIERLFPPEKFPKQKITDLALEHPIFHTVFDLKEQPQVPGIEWMKYYLSRGTTYEFKRGETGYEDVHYRGIYDDKGRLMVFICHNTDLGDGWEREGDREDYFRTFSEPKAFPMGINAIVYAMTH
jgi:hypothetical protein